MKLQTETVRERSERVAVLPGGKGPRLALVGAQRTLRLALRVATVGSAVRYTRGR
jgi:hypothetical protein